jgi:DNA adenine methylase
MSYGGKSWGGYSQSHCLYKDRNFYMEVQNSYNKIKPMLKYVEFHNKSYLDFDLKNCVIYCDPPYSPLTKTSDFSKYAVNDFNPTHHTELKNLALKASTEKGCTVIISNHDTDYTRDLYREADDIIAFDVKRTISSKISERKKAPEVLAIYKGK